MKEDIQNRIEALEKEMERLEKKVCSVQCIASVNIPVDFFLELAGCEMKKSSLADHVQVF